MGGSRKKGSEKNLKKISGGFRIVHVRLSWFKRPNRGGGEKGKRERTGGGKTAPFTILIVPQELV